MTDKTNKLTMYLVTKKELNLIKNDCAYPERQFCDGCEYADGEDNTRASGLGCNFEGANAVMDRVLSRPAPAALETEHEQYERICKEVSQEEHDATIAKAERERVLKECCKQCPIRNEEMPLDDRCAESCEGCLIKSVVEHLRTASTGDDER